MPNGCSLGSSACDNMLPGLTVSNSRSYYVDIGTLPINSILIDLADNSHLSINTIYKIKVKTSKTGQQDAISNIEYANKVS